MRVATKTATKANDSFTGGSVQRSAGLFTRKQEMEELRLKAAKLQKDCIAAQEKTDQCKEQVDALQAELTATASEQITAANDRVRAEAEQKRLEAAAAHNDEGVVRQLAAMIPTFTPTRKNLKV